MRICNDPYCQEPLSEDLDRRQKYCSRICAQRVYNDRYRKNKGMKKRSKILKCPFCEELFIQQRKSQRFCKASCRIAYIKQGCKNDGILAVTAYSCKRCDVITFRENGFCSDSCMNIWKDAPKHLQDLVELLAY